MLERWNDALTLLEQRLSAEGANGADEGLDVAELAATTATSEYHFRRVFSTLAAMPVSEYVRRRRLTLAAGDLASGRGGVLDVAVRYGWGSGDAFSRAFRGFHGVTPSAARRPGVVLRTQPRLTFHLRLEGADPVRHRIEHTDAFLLAGRHARLPLVYEGENTAMTAFHQQLPADLDDRLAALRDATEGACVAELPGVLSVSSGFTADRADGSDFDYHHAVAVPPGVEVPADLDTLPVAPTTWAVFEAEGETGGGVFQARLQQLWADAFSQWFPANPFELAPGPEILHLVDDGEDGGRGRGELWLPVSPAGG